MFGYFKTMMLGALALCCSQAALAVEVTTVSYKGDSAEAGLYSSDECGYYEAAVYLYENAYRDGRTVDAGQYGYGYFYITNWCTNMWASSWFDLSGTNFVANGQRGARASYAGTASYNRAIDCGYTACACQNQPGEYYCIDETESGTYWCECPNSDGLCGYWQCGVETVTVPVAVDLTWTPTGDGWRGVSTWSNRGENYSYRSRGVGSTAVCNLSGSFVVDGIDLLAGAAYSWGNSSTSSSGAMWLYRFDR